ncbi:MAG: hypothetical protein LQ346_004648 [Caloplaca aetnensis]|nr:MAG: hypothetical protein LQ346_004648 [Caloplaca aetnensis]
MAPTTRRRAAQLKANENPDQSASSATDQSPPDPPPVAKAKKPKKDTKTSPTKASAKASAKITKSKTPSWKTKKSALKYDPKADPRIGMKGFLPNGLPDTGNELFIPGYQKVIPQTPSGPESLQLDFTKDTGVTNAEAAATEPNESARSPNDAPSLAKERDAQDQVEPDNTYGTMDSPTPEPEPTYPRTHKVRYGPEVFTSYPLEVSGVSMPNLTNDIHDIWDRARHDHWKLDSQLSHNQDWRIYEILVPAQRLASLWLTRPEYQRFWTTLLYAPYELDAKRNTWDIENDAIEMTSKHRIDLEKRLRDTAKKIHFRFAPLECTEGQWAHSEAINSRNSDSWKGDSFEPGYMTVLHDDFMFIPWPNADPPVWMEASTCAKLRFLFLLAVQLGGQLAEVLWMDRRRKEQADDDDMDGRQGLSIGKSRYRNMSHAFECWVLGGRLQVVNNWPDAFCPEGLAVTAVDYVTACAEVKILAMKGIHRQFSSDHWASAGPGKRGIEH